MGVFATALVCLALPSLAGAQSQVGPDYFNQPTQKLVNFDTDPSNNPIADGTSLQVVYGALGISFDNNDRAVAFDDYGTSAPNQATGSADELQSLNVYLPFGTEAAGAWGYDFTMRAFDADGGLILEISYTDGRVCPRPNNFREQRFLGIAAGNRPIHQVQFSRFYQDQVACGFRIDDFQYLRQDPPPPPTPITGNVQIAWNSCLGTGTAQPYITFDCNNSSALHSLVGSFQVQNGYPNFITLAVSMDIVLDGQSSIAPFWHFENGGCNAGTVGASDAIPASCTGFGNPYGPGGGDADAFITAYQAGFSFPNYGRMLAAVARDSQDPVNLAAAPSRYYGFTLDFDMLNGTTCAGCDLASSLRVNSLLLFDTSGGSGSIISPTSAGSSPCVAVNNGGSLCDPTPTVKSSWGKLKGLYR